MDPWIIPAGPVADHEVTSDMPLEANHRRQRHAPLTHASAWMKKTFGKHPYMSEQPAITRMLDFGNSEDETDDLESKDSPESFLATVFWTTNIESEDFEDGEFEIDEDSPRTQDQDHQFTLAGPSERKLSETSFKIRSSKRKGLVIPKIKSKSLPSLPTPKLRSKSSLPSLPTKRGAGFPRIDYGPVNVHTALRSHPPSREEINYPVQLSEGWRVWRAKRRMDFAMVSRVQDQRQDQKVQNGQGSKGKSSKAKIVKNRSLGALRSLYSRR